MKLSMNTLEQRKALSEVALGNLPPDTIVKNGTVFNVFTGEFIQDQSIWIKDGRIAYVGPDPHPLQDDTTKVIDAEGRVLLPGLIDAHTHIISRTNIEAFVQYVIPSGTTTVITEMIELAMAKRYVDRTSISDTPIAWGPRRRGELRSANFAFLFILISLSLMFFII